MSIVLEALSYLGVVLVAAGVAGVIVCGIVWFDDWTDRMAQRAADRRSP